MRFALTVALVLLAATARADEPTKFYLEDGKVTAKKVADLEKRIEALEAKCAKPAAGEPGAKSGECTNCPCCQNCPHCSGKATGAKSAPVIPAGAFYTDFGTLVRWKADGRTLEEVPGSAPTTVLPSYAPAYSTPTVSSCAGGACAPSYAPQYLPAWAAPSYTLPAAPQSCTSGKCPLPR